MYLHGLTSWGLPWGNTDPEIPPNLGIESPVESPCSQLVGEKGGNETPRRKAAYPELILASVCWMMSSDKRGRERWRCSRLGGSVNSVKGRPHISRFCCSSDEARRGRHIDWEFSCWLGVNRGSRLICDYRDISKLNINILSLFMEIPINSHHVKGSHGLVKAQCKASMLPKLTCISLSCNYFFPSQKESPWGMRKSCSISLLAQLLPCTLKI